MTNKKLGNDFESELCKMLFDQGFWAHNFGNKTNGQPADIIAARNGKAYLIDAKVCSRDTFDTTRIEENQKNSMILWDKTNNGKGYFALKLTDDSIYFIDHLTILMARQDKVTLNRSDIVSIGIPYRIWLEGCI